MDKPIIFQDPAQTHVFVQESFLSTRVIEIWIDTDVDSPVYYREALSALMSANEGDIVNIYINSYGGRVDTLVRLINAISQCKGEVHGHLMSQAQSAAGMLFLSCHVPHVYDFVTFMAHTPSFGEGGKANDIFKSVDHSKRYLRDICERVYENFLTLNEIEDILDGGSIYLDFDEITERLEERGKILMKEYEDFSKELSPLSREDLMKLNKKQIIDSFLGEEEVDE